MTGIEFMIDILTKAPTTEERDTLIREAFKTGLLILAAGPSSPRLASPVIVTRDQAEVGLQILEEGIARVEAEVRR